MTGDKDRADADGDAEKRRDEILKRMLQTPPKPKVAAGEPKGHEPEKRQASRRSRKNRG